MTATAFHSRLATLNAAAFVDDFPEFGPTVPASHIIADEPF